MRASGTDLPVMDRRGFFRLAFGGAGLASVVAAGAAAGINRRELMDIGAAGAGIAAAVAVGTALAQEQTPLSGGGAEGAASPMPVGVMPVGAMPVGAMPVGVMPVGVMPVGAMPVGVQPATLASLLTEPPLGLTPPAPAFWPGPMKPEAPNPLEAAAESMSAGRRIVVLCGPGASDAREEVGELADTLGAPVVRAVPGDALGRVPFTACGIGDLGAAAASWAMRQCDTLIVLGAAVGVPSPWSTYMPGPGQARLIRIGHDGGGAKDGCPAEVALNMDVKSALRMLLPRLGRHADRDFLLEARRRMAEWNQRLAEAETASRARSKPRAARGSTAAFSDLNTARGQFSAADEDGAYFDRAHALISFDGRTKTWVTARHRRHASGD